MCFPLRLGATYITGTGEVHELDHQVQIYNKFVPKEQREYRDWLRSKQGEDFRIADGRRCNILGPLDASSSRDIVAEYVPDEPSTGFDDLE